MPAFDPDKYLASKQSSFDPDAYLASKQPNLSPLNSLYDVGEKALMRGIEYASPVLSTIGNISRAGSELATKAVESTPLGIAGRFVQQSIGSVIPEEIKQARLSDIAPSLYSKTGEGIQLQRGGALDPTAQEAYTGAEQMALDPLNLVPLGGGFGKAAKGIKSLVGKAGTEVAEVAGTAMTGVPKHVIKNYKKFAPEIEKMRLSGSGIESLANEVNQNVAFTIKDKLAKTGQELGDEISKAGGSVDLKQVKSSFEKAIDEGYKDFLDNPSPVNEAKVNQLEKIRNQFFATDTLSPAGAFKLQQDLKDIMAFTPKTLEGKYSGMSQAERAITKSADDAYNNINKQLETLTDGATSTLKNKYKKYIEIRDRLEPIAGGDSQKTLNALKTLKRPDRKILKAEIKKIDKELGTNISDSVDLLETYSYLGEPSWNPLSGGSTTSTTRTLGNLALGSILGGGINPITATMMAGAGSPAMLKQALNLGINVGKVGEGVKNITSKIPMPTLTPAQQLAAYQGLAALGQQQ